MFGYRKRKTKIGLRNLRGAVAIYKSISPRRLPNKEALRPVKITTSFDTVVSFFKYLDNIEEAIDNDKAIITKAEIKEHETYLGNFFINQEKSYIKELNKKINFILPMLELHQDKIPDVVFTRISKLLLSLYHGFREIV